MRVDDDILTFLQGYWRTRMDEIHSLDAKRDVDRCKLRELGVRIIEDPDSSSDMSSVSFTDSLLS